MTDLDDLVAISRYAGADVLLVQGGGGNTSVKSADGERMWIKASGLRLAQVQAGFGYLETRVDALTALLDDPALRALPRQAAHEAAVARTQAATVGGGALRPSLETTFHAVLGRAVLHTHPVYINAFTCMAEGADALSLNLPEPTVWVPYATPGYALGRAVWAGVREFEADWSATAETIFLENHGFIAAAETAEAVMTNTDRVVQIGERFFGALPADALATAAPQQRLAAWADGLREALQQRYGLAPGAFSVRAATRQAVIKASKEPERWLLAGALVPDDVVYGGHRVWAAVAGRSAAAWLDEAPEAWPETGRLIVVLRGLGVVLAGPSAAFIEAMEENLLAHVLIRRLIARRGEAVSLPGDEVAYLLGMELERYRQGVAAGRG